MSVTPLDVKKGDKGAYRKWSGTEITLDNVDDYVIVKRV